MAGRKEIKKAAAKACPKHTCGECANSYDWHEIGADGKPFMCRCPHYTGGRFCRFLSDPQCDKFKPRKNGED